jgi:hypothetical protein
VRAPHEAQNLTDDRADPAVLVASLSVEAQSRRIFRVGYLGGSPPSPEQPPLNGFVRGLHERNLMGNMRVV